MSSFKSIQKLEVGMRIDVYKTMERNSHWEVNKSASLNYLLFDNLHRSHLLVRKVGCLIVKSLK